MPLFFRTRYRPMRMRICRAHYITQFTYKGVKMKKTEGKRTSVAEYVRKRACGQQVNVEQRKESTSAACEKTATGQQEEKRSDLELLRVLRKKSTSWKCFRRCVGTMRMMSGQGR